jgi:hypothetical protein
MEPTMTTAIIATTIVLGSVLTAQAGPLRAHQHATVMPRLDRGIQYAAAYR